MCLFPQIINNPKYKANKKNKGKIPKVKDKRVLYVPVACGNCIECRKAKARNWQVRLQEEIKVNNNGKFVTLTFSDKSIKELTTAINNNTERTAKLLNKNKNGLSGYNMDNEIATIAVRRFLERWRKKYKKSVRHWLVTELGGTRTERIHLHGIIFTNESNKTINDIWKYGYTYIGDYVSSRTINYIVKYVSKQDKIHPNYNSKVLTSQGIGKGYINSKQAEYNKYKIHNTNESYITREGVKLSLPIYYRNKIYTEEEREKLWIEKLDKQIRYVLGKEIDISKNENIYYKQLEIARQKNKRLGYGNGDKNWEKRKYENQRRNLKKYESLRSRKNIWGKKDDTN